MDVARGPVTRAAGFLHHHVVWLVAGIASAAGLWLRGRSWEAPAALLALLLFNARLGV